MTSEEALKIELMEEYITTLEKENFAKNSETSLLYQQLDSLRNENGMLKSLMDNMKNKWEEQRIEFNQRIQEKEEQVLNNRDYGHQLRSSVDVGSLKSIAEDMRIELEMKETQINQLMNQNYQLEKQTKSYQEQMTQITFKMMKSEEKFRNLMQINKQLQGEIFGLKNSRIDRSRISFAKLQTEKLVKQNNELIEKVRILEKEKNSYYKQLKMTSPLKNSSRINRQNLSCHKKRPSEQTSATKNGKSERWNLMEEKLRAIRNENEQIKANLAIN